MYLFYWNVFNKKKHLKVKKIKFFIQSPKTEKRLDKISVQFRKSSALQ